MVNNLKFFTSSAKDLSRNPLGIIALFIVLVYGFACLLFGFSAKDLTSPERFPLVWFTVLFPTLVLFAFVFLVAKHHDKLYFPRDYRDDDAFFRTVRDNQSKPVNAEASVAEIEDLMDYGAGFKIIEIQEKAIKDDLERRRVDYSGDTAKVLIRQLAASQVLQWFEKTYSLIFGSQIALLKSLSANFSGFSFDDITTYYESFKKQHPVEYNIWNIDNYLNFLFSSNLIVRNREIIQITESGREFLMLLTKAGYTEFKSF